jgi:PAS domain S-box-containing protein
MFGYSTDEMVGQSIRRIIPDDRQSEETEVLERIGRGERVDHFETVRRRKDGSLLSVSLTVSPMRDRDGRVIGASKIARDISERLRLQGEAREQAAISRHLAGIGVALASTLDRDTIVRRVTESAIALTNAEFGFFLDHPTEPNAPEPYRLAALIGAPQAAFARWADGRASTLFAPTLEGKRTGRLEDLMPDAGVADADQLNVRSFLAVPLKAASGAVIGGLFVGHSSAGCFTEQHEQLAAGVAAWASVALQNAQLYVDARDANRMKDEFLAVLSHELRTPLNAIVGYSRLLRGGMLAGEKAERGFETLERNATVLTQIVEDVLDVSRIVAGKIRLDIQAVELPLVIHNSVATVQPAADAKGVQLRTVIDATVEPVSADSDRLQQVIWNLLSNAVKFTPRNGQVTVALQRANSHVEIVVTDTGIGIRSGFLPHVFERFRQADAGITRKTGGLGLGLAIVRHIVEMHGGTVHAESAGEGQGSTFRVRLPSVVVPPQTLEGHRDRGRAERLERLTRLGDLRGVRVLAVDDEADALMLLRVILESAGADVITVNSPVEALHRLQSVRPHAIVIDLGMPAMDGFELIARIRRSSDPAVRDVPAAALTAFARSEDRTKALRSGFEIHLAKPVDPGELVASVSTLVRRARRVSPTG